MIQSFTRQQKTYAVVLAALLLVLAIALVFLRGERGGTLLSVSCPVQTITVEGSDMAPAYSAGQELAFYTRNDSDACAFDDKLAIGDVVLFQTAIEGRQVPLFVKALPGMTLALAEAEAGESDQAGTAIVVNGERVANSQGQVILLNEPRAKMIGMYIDSYKGIVPEGAHLLLGDNPAGAYDSTRLGLLDSRDFVGVLKK